MLARQMNRTIKNISYDVVGGNAKDMVNNNGQLYKGPSWFIEGGGNDDIYTGIYR